MNCSKPWPVRRRSKRLIPCLPVLGLALLTSACTTWFNDQIDVPGTNQRLIVGHDGWPFRKAWVMEDGKLQTVKIVRENR
jgi:hypothetical protein